MSKITVNTKEKRFPVAPDLYGLFFEDINRAGDGGLYPEMLRNRSFEDSIPPARCTVSDDKTTFTTPMGWSDQFNGGEGLRSWLGGVAPTEIPAWYGEDVTLALDEGERLNEKRLVALKATFSPNGILKNVGYHGVAVEEGKTYAFYMFAKAESTPVSLTAALVSEDGTVLDETSFLVNAGGYSRFDFTFAPKGSDDNAFFRFTAPEGGTIFFGFVSLMPTDTYKGHGMRKDLMEKLAGLHPRFLRFPGGCIVEGFTFETAMRFPNTIGPVWERPSHNLMWHYRTGNGLGFHEYLQICEDLDIEPMYVINCGLTCQGREPEFFEGEALEELLNETFDAIEYATGDESTPMGKKRAEMGHPAPFKLSYIEIGNENAGEDYFWRYKKFYDALKARYPEIRYIANVHTELEGLPTEFADEHYYNTPEFFLERVDQYDSYDRNGPKIFLGEYAVTVGHTATLRCALAEAAFLLGVENNQDVVTLTSYAPLFQHLNYTAWYPNLIAYDNRRSYGIPTYHALSLLAGVRGSNVVGSETETGKSCRKVSGYPGIYSNKSGVTFKNAALNGEPVSITRKVQGDFSQNGDEFTTVSIPPVRKGYLSPYETLAEDYAVLGFFGDTPSSLYTFEIEAKTTAENPITFAVWAHKPVSVFRLDETKDPDEIDMRSARMFEWTVDGKKDTVSEFFHRRHYPTAEEAPLSFDPTVFNRYKIVTREDGFDCYINDVLVRRADLPRYPTLISSTADSEDEIVLKFVNFSEKEDEVLISLDCVPESRYTVTLLSGDPESENSLDNPENVSVVTEERSGAAKEFTYKAPPFSLQVLRLKKA